MKHCQFCGFEMTDTAVFCENCGKNVDEVVSEKEPQKGEKCCKTCGEIYSKKAKTCPNCGVNSHQRVAAKLIKCKKCGHPIAANAIQCPSCGQKKHSAFTMVAQIILVLAVALFTIILLDSESEPSSKTDTPVAGDAAVTEPQNRLLYSDDFFDVEYMKVYDVDGINTSYLQLKITNKSVQKVTLLLDDVYVNDMAVESGTGLPIKLETGKISTSPFVLFTGNTGLAVEDITKIEFKVKGLDDGYKTVHTTDTIVIEF